MNNKGNSKNNSNVGGRQWKNWRKFANLIMVLHFTISAKAIILALAILAFLHNHIEGKPSTESL